MVRADERGRARRFEVRAGAVTTQVVLGRGVVEEAVGLAVRAPCTLLVIDEALRALPWAAVVVDHLRDRARQLVITDVTAAESAKCLASVERAWRAWSGAGAGRDAVVLAIGGGLVSDVGGFAAACYHRGVAWIAVPTTTLGMADAALGGKTGVNLDGGKNLVGAVHQPVLVAADLAALDTLPVRARRDGFAEVVKAGVIADAALVAECVRDAPRALAGDDDVTAALIAGALRVKADVVEADAHEGSRREILNFGHTVGHALERATAHALSHGEAVAIGIVAESRLAVRRGRLEPGAPGDIARACAAFGLPTAVPGGLDHVGFREALRLDKKRREGALRAALPSAWGRHDDAPSVVTDEDELIACLEERLPA